MMFVLVMVMYLVCWLNIVSGVVRWNLVMNWLVCGSGCRLLVIVLSGLVIIGVMVV